MINLVCVSQGAGSVRHVARAISVGKINSNEETSNEYRSNIDSGDEDSDLDSVI